MATISFSGLASGIDGDAVIKAMLDAKRVQNIPLENKLAQNSEETTALTEFNTKLLKLRDLLKDFTTVAGAPISKVATSSHPDAVGVSATSNAFASSVSINVSQIARGGTLSFNDRFSEVDAKVAPGISSPETLNISVGLGDKLTSLSITITNETTLREVAQAINDQSNGKVVASMVNVGTDASPEFLLLLNSSETGEEKGTLAASVSSGLEAFAGFTVEQARDAIFHVSGIGEVTRPTNQVQGLLPGLTFDLKQAGTGPVQLNVSNNAGKTAEKLEAVVTAVNELIGFSRDNSKVERQESEGNITNTFGTLANSRVDEQFISSMREAFSSAGGGLEGAVRMFADLGVSIQRDGTYKFDGEKFNEALSKEPSAVSQILSSFADRLGSASGLIQTYTGFDGMLASAKRSNDTQNERINDKIARVETMLQRQEQNLKLMFASLESTIGRLNSQGNALASVLSSLDAGK